MIEATSSEVLTAARPSGPTAAPAIAELIQARLPWLFLLYAVPAVIFLSVVMAPFQVADERAHALRADQVGRGVMVSPPIGGIVDGGLVSYAAPYESMWFHAEVKQTVALAEATGRLRWSEPERDANFQNTAQYGPLLYLPQAIGIRIGQLADLSVAQTLAVARIINGLASCLIGFFALAICRRGRALLFTTLLLPMTLSEFGSVSQCALIIALSLLIVAVASRALLAERPAGTNAFVLFAAVVVATTLARPPQAALVLLAPAFLAWRDPAWAAKGAIAAAAIVILALWMWHLGTLMPPVPDELSVSGQFGLLLADPLLLPTVMANALAGDADWLASTVVGRLGWLDTPMPPWYYAAAGIVLALSLIAPPLRGPYRRPAVLALATCVGLVTAVCGALYLTWTPLGKETIHGLQGRYVLPVLPLLAWLVPSPGRRAERVLSIAWYPVILFPIVSLAALPGVLMERYYGSWSVMAHSLQALLLP